MSSGSDVLSEHLFSTFTKGKINWADSDNLKTWEDIKTASKVGWKNGQEYDSKTKIKKMFVAHSNDTIRGRPQLIDQTQKRIPLVRWCTKKEDGDSGKQTNLVTYFFDDKFDKRFVSQELELFALDFWFYRVITEEGKEYYLLSQKQFPNEVCDFSGMIVEMDDFAELTQSMRMKSLSRVMFVKSFVPSVKTITPEELVQFTKHRKITEDKFLSFLAYHPELNSWNRFPEETEKLKAAQILSSKADGYPLHIGVIGVAGSRKSKGYVETTAHKFSEHPHIVEGANSRIKGLSPSFKEKPANLGYLANCERMGFVDELSKMIEAEQKTHDNMGNVLGEINASLDHSRREVTSGNDNSCIAEATSKFLFVMNPLSKKRSIYDHVGVIDKSTMSRLLWWVQDSNEIDFVHSEDGIIRKVKNVDEANDKLIILSDTKEKQQSLCWVDFDRDEFLTLFDSCQNILCPTNDKKVEKLANMITNLARNPMKEVWRPRGDHHVKLLIDGLVKLRCLFVDYDDTFKPKQCDYDMAKRILMRMLNSWETNFLEVEEKEWSGI